jgi:hypothetical protein
MIAKSTHIGLAWFAGPKRLGLATMLDQLVWVKKFKIFQKHD